MIHCRIQRVDIRFISVYVISSIQVLLIQVHLLQANFTSSMNPQQKIIKNTNNSNAAIYSSRNQNKEGKNNVLAIQDCPGQGSRKMTDLQKISENPPALSLLEKCSCCPGRGVEKLPTCKIKCLNIFRPYALEHLLTVQDRTTRGRKMTDLQNKMSENPSSLSPSKFFAVQDKGVEK